MHRERGGGLPRVRHVVARGAPTLLAALACRSSPGVLVPAVTDSATSVYDVANLKVIHRVNDASDVVVVRLYLLGGTRQLTEDNAGIELLLLRAAALESGRAMRRTGSQPILEVTPDWTVIGFAGLRAGVDSSWAALTRHLERASVSEASLERARGELLAFARRRYTEPDLRVRVWAQRNAFRGHPYELDPEGTERSLSQVSAADVERYRDDHIVTSRMLLVIVGEVTRTQVESLVTRTLGLLPQGQYRWSLPPPVPRRATRWLADQQDLPTNYILGYFGGPSPHEEDYFAFRIAVSILSGVLAAEIRNRASMSYVVYAPFLDRARPIGGIYASTPNPGDGHAMIQGALETMRAFRFEGFGALVDGVALGELARRMTSDGQAEALARAYLLFGDVAMADAFVDRLRQVDGGAVRRAARSYMRDIQFGFMGDTAKLTSKVVRPR